VSPGHLALTVRAQLRHTCLTANLAPDPARRALVAIEPLDDATIDGDNRRQKLTVWRDSRR